MRTFFFSIAAACGLALATLSTGLAHDGMTRAGDIEITHVWARAMLPNQPAGAGYLYVTNTGSEPDSLVGASSPAAGRVEIHAMQVINDVMTMRPVEGGLEIAADTTVKLEPGGLHVMFMDVAEPFKDGDHLQVTLEFERAGNVDVTFPVRKAHGGGHGDH
ncbi:MAG: copper chaperone PCu(A)C [Rhizobiaceae bacterium]|nr:copper chaperone PCu(A)C [Rhizobiaceae bacterium]